jgi:hypothetical protein
VGDLWRSRSLGVGWRDQRWVSLGWEVEEVRDMIPLEEVASWGPHVCEGESTG